MTLDEMLDQLSAHVQAGVINVVTRDGEQIIKFHGSRLECAGMAHQAATVLSLGDWQDDDDDDDADEEDGTVTPETFGQYL